MGTFTPELGLNVPTPNDPAVANVWPSLWNTNAGIISSSIAGLLSLDVSGSANVALTFTNGSPSQTDNAIFVLTGALTGNIDVLFPNGKTKLFMVKNSTSGAFTLSLGVNSTGSPGTPAGTVAAIAQGTTGMFYSDGTNVFSAFPAIPTSFANLTVTATFTGPDGGLWNSTGISNIASLSIGQASSSISITRFVNSTGTFGAIGDAHDVLSNTLNTIDLAVVANGDLFAAWGSTSAFLFWKGLSEVGRWGTDGSWLVGTTTNAGPGAIADAKGNVRDIPVNTQGSSYTLVSSDNGKQVVMNPSGNVTVPNSVFSANNNLVVINLTGGPITLVQGAGMSMIFAGQALTGNRTLAHTAMVTLIFQSGSQCLVSGAGIT